MKCKYCNTEIEGNNYKMAAHVRHQCTVKKAMRNGDQLTPTGTTFDPVMLINSLNAEHIRQEIVATDRRKAALSALLAVAEANEPKPEPATV